MGAVPVTMLCAQAGHLTEALFLFDGFYIALIIGSRTGVQRAQPV
jgi:hypothetical protein